MVLASARKLKKTRRQEQAVVENMNHAGIQYLLQQNARWAQQMIELQKNFLAVVQALKRRGIVDDLMISQELTAIEDMEKMKRDALIIDPNKK